MKIFRLVCILSIIFFFQQNSAWAQIKMNPALFLKKWKVAFDEEQYVQNMPQGQKEAFLKLPPEKQQRALSQMKEEAKLYVFKFSAAGTVEVLLEGETIEKGTWKIQPDGKTIIARNEMGYEDEIEILEIANDKLVFNSTQYGKGLTLVPDSQN